VQAVRENLLSSGLGTKAGFSLDERYALANGRRWQSCERGEKIRVWEVPSCCREGVAVNNSTGPQRCRHVGLWQRKRAEIEKKKAGSVAGLERDTKRRK